MVYYVDGRIIFLPILFPMDASPSKVRWKLADCYSTFSSLSAINCMKKTLLHSKSWSLFTPVFYLLLIMINALLLMGVFEFPIDERVVLFWPCKLGWQSLQWVVKFENLPLVFLIGKCLIYLLDRNVRITSFLLGACQVEFHPGHDFSRRHAT